MGFSPTQASLEGFRLIGYRPVSFLVWTVLVVLEFGLFGWAVYWAWGSELASLAAAKAVDPADFAPGLFRLALAMVVVVPAALMINAVLTAAVYRSIVQPTQKAFGYVRLGGDELRLILLQLLFMVVCWTVCGVAMGAMFWTNASQTQLGVKILIEIVTGLAGVAAMILLGVRFSLAGPLIVAQGHLSFRAAWRLTRRRFWPLLLMALLAVLLAAGVSMVSQIFFQPFSNLVAASFNVDSAKGSLTAGVNPFAAIAANPWLYGVLAVLALAVSALQVVVQIAPFAAAYRDIDAGG